tara:strand:- start:411 stop:842 length:432 start_codon:yes stop_codon:yes gene_type:complete
MEKKKMKNKPTTEEKKLTAKHQDVYISDKKSIKILKARDKVSDFNECMSKFIVKAADKEIKDLEKIVEIQERTIAAEKTVSNNIFKRWNDQDQIIVDWRYSYWMLERKFATALEEIRFLNHYINQKDIAKTKKRKRYVRVKSK